MSDILPFEFKAVSDLGFKLTVANRKFDKVSRAWYWLADPKGRPVKDGPIQGLFQWWFDVGFIKGYPAMAENKQEIDEALEPVTPKDIMSRFSDFGEWEQQA